MIARIAVLGWLGCDVGPAVVSISEPTEFVPDTDTDADTDSDSDTDADMDSDADVDAEPVVSSETVASTETTEPTEPTDSNEPIDPGWIDTAIEPATVVVPLPDVVVDCAGGGTFVTIQEAIDGSVSGTRIGVAACTYTEVIDFRGKSLDIYGLTGDAADVTLDGGGADILVRAVRGESLGTRIAWMTLTGGKSDAGSDEGAAVTVNFASLELDGVVVTGNFLSDQALSVYGGGLKLLHSTVVDNGIKVGGQALTGTAGALTISESTVDCSGGAMAIFVHMPLQILDSTITCATGDFGVQVDGGEVHVRRSVVIGGGTAALTAEDGSDNLNERAYLYNSVFVGGNRGAELTYMHSIVENSVFIGDQVGLELQDNRFDSVIRNSAFEGLGCDLAGDNGNYTVEFNAFDNTVDCDIEGEHSVTPMELEAPPDDVHPVFGSPLVDGGDPDNSLDDADGSRNDIGRWGGPRANRR